MNNDSYNNELSNGLFKSKLKTLSKCCIITFALFFLFIGLKMIAYSLPDRLVKENVIESMEQLNKEGVYPRPYYDVPGGSFYGQQLDNWTDSIYLNISYFAKEKPLLLSVFGDYRGSGKGDNELEILNSSLALDMKDEDPGLYPYARQWFGCEVIVRPLLCLFSLPQIRLINQAVFMILLFWALRSICVNINKYLALSFLIGLLSVAVFTIPNSLNILNSFWITIAAAIVLPKLKASVSEFLIMYVIGGLTAFLDLFFTPLLTFTVVIQLLLFKKIVDDRPMSFRKGFWILVKSSLGWVGGYLILWSGKWLGASLFLRRNLFVEAYLEAKLLTGSEALDYGPDSALGFIKESLRLNFSNLFPVNLLLEKKGLGTIILFLLIAVVLLLSVMKMRHMITFRKCYWNILIAASAPYVWYIVVSKHSFMHFWVSYRLQAGTVMGIVLFLTLLLNPKACIKNR